MGGVGGIWGDSEGVWGALGRILGGGWGGCGVTEGQRSGRGHRSQRPLPSLQFEEVAEKDDLMGVEDTARKDILTAAAP